MNETRQNVAVGLFVLVGIAALATLIVVFGQASWSPAVGGTVLNVRFDKAPGIRDLTPVTIGGIMVGRVTNVEFANPDTFEGGVLVELQLDPGRKVRRGTRAATAEPGVGMGRPPIELYPGPPEEPILESGAIIDGDMTSMMASIIPPEIIATIERSATHLGDAAEAMTPVLADLHEVLRPRRPADVDLPGGPAGNLSSAVVRLDDALRHFNAVLGDEQVQSQVRTAVANFYQMSEDGKEVTEELRVASTEFRGVTEKAGSFLENTGGAVDDIRGQVRTVAEALKKDLDLAAGVLQQLHGISVKIDRGEGSIGKVLNDPKLYESMVLTFRQLTMTVEEFRLLIKQWQEGKIRVGL